MCEQQNELRVTQVPMRYAHMLSLPCFGERSKRKQGRNGEQERRGETVTGHNKRRVPTTLATDATQGERVSGGHKSQPQHIAVVSERLVCEQVAQARAGSTLSGKGLQTEMRVQSPCTPGQAGMHSPPPPTRAAQPEVKVTAHDSTTVNAHVT